MPIAGKSRAREGYRVGKRSNAGKDFSEMVKHLSNLPGTWRWKRVHAAKWNSRTIFFQKSSFRRESVNVERDGARANVVLKFACDGYGIRAKNYSSNPGGLNVGEGLSDFYKFRSRYYARI